MFGGGYGVFLSLRLEVKSAARAAKLDVGFFGLQRILAVVSLPRYILGFTCVSHIPDYT